MTYDVVATAVPFLPAGASAGLKAYRAGNSVRSAATIGWDTATVARTADRVTSVAPTATNAAVQGSKYHKEVGVALDEAGSLSSTAANAFTGSARARGGPDVAWNGSNMWLVLTTAGSWQSHVTKYGSQYGEGIPLIYQRSMGLTNTTQLRAGASAATSGFGSLQGLK